MFAVSIKGVLFTAEREKVVLALNGRDDWELPGGRIEVGETSADCLAREFAEELGLTVDVDSCLIPICLMYCRTSMCLLSLVAVKLKEVFPNY